MLSNLAFLNPMLLWGLVALPLVWWLLRATPPQPQRVWFPGTRLLKGLRSRQQTPARSPWWLTALRMLAAALLIGALAEPILNPRVAASIGANGPLVLVLDNGWASGPHWQDRRQAVLGYLDDAAAAGRSIVLVPTALVPGGPKPKLLTPAAARDALEALKPMPYAPDRAAALAGLAAALPAGARSVVWLADGLDHDGTTSGVFAKLTEAAGGGSVTVVEPKAEQRPVAVRLEPGTTGSALRAEVLSPGGAARDVLVSAVSGAGQPLGDTRLKLGSGATSVSGPVDLPLELRNQIARLEIAGERSAGAVALLDTGSRWNRIGLISGASREQAQPLLAPLFYLERALAPFSDLVKADDPNTSAAIDSLLRRNVSVLVLADIGKLTEATTTRLNAWVSEGGVLLRFSGARMEEAGDTLLPTPLRAGAGRTLGGALSWSSPQSLAPFEEDGPFAGLFVPPDVKVSRQVLADPALLSDTTRVWARLEDGTPLVTAAKQKGGWLVLFHITANSDWSSLPISGLFVDMLRRVVRLTGLADVTGATEATSVNDAAPQAADVLPPSLTLDGFGTLGPPPATAEALTASAPADTVPSAKHPPGLYGPPGAVRALNIVNASTVLKPLPALPSSFARASYEADAAVPLKPWALTAALGLFLADVLAILGLQTSWFRNLRGLPRAAASVTAVLLVLAAAAGTADPVLAQTPGPPPTGTAAGTDAAAFALEAAEKTRLAYVITGDAPTDETSLRGLTGLSLILNDRTAVEPDPPMGVKVESDELAFFPILYWPVLPDAPPLDDKTAARIDAYVKGGGMLVFDTRDSGDLIPGFESGTGGTAALQRLVGKLDLPPLEPAPANHVLGRSFYILKQFPGRYDTSPLWVEAAGATDGDAGPADIFGDGAPVAAAGTPDRPVRQDDGVSAVLVTANDLAGAWAVDENREPLNAVIPGGEEQREMAYRVGVNIVMYALTGNYKSDQVHVPALLQRLGQ